MSPGLRECFPPAGVQGRIFRLGTWLSLDDAPGTASELIMFLVVDAECTGTVEGRVKESSCLRMLFLSIQAGFSLARKLFIVINRQPSLRFVCGWNAACVHVCAFICNLTSTLFP